MGAEAQSKLTMTAKGVGFEETAKAVDTLANAQHRLGFAQEALAEALKSGSIGEVGRLTDEVGTLKSVIDQLSSAQLATNAASRDYLKVLREINPSLAGFVDSMLSAVRVAGDLSGKNIDLANAVDFAKNAVSRYRSALGLLAAGSAAVAGIALLTKAWRENADEVKRAEEAVKKHNEALKETARARGERSSSLEAISDTRREGGFTAAEADAATQTVDRVRKRFPDLDESSINRAVALIPGADDKEIAEAAFLDQRGSLQVKAESSPENRRRRFERSRDRNSSALGTFIAREEEQRAALVRSAFGEVTGTSPNQGAFEKFIGTLPGNAYTGREKELAELGIEFSKLEPLGGQGAAGGRGFAVSDEDLQTAQQNKFAADRGVSAGDAGDTREAIRQLTRAIDRLASEPRTVNYNNSRIMGADAATRKARTVNGESQRARIEAP